MKTIVAVLLLRMSTAHWGSGITIEIYNLAQIGSKSLAQAEQLASAVFVVAGIDARWTTGSPSDTAHLVNDFSAAPQGQCVDLPITIVRVQILPRAPKGFSAQALGYALPCAKLGMQVTLYVDRMDSVSDMQSVAFQRVLGYTLAHEVGHVIHRSNAHERSGLMKAVWTRQDWQRAAMMVIPFTP